MSENSTLKELLRTTGKELLQHKELDKLKVSDICKICNMSRPVFYHYYIDKYDLVRSIYLDDYQAILMSLSEDVTFEKILFQLLNTVKTNVAFYKHTLISLESTTRYNPMREHLKQIIICYITRMNHHTSLSEQLSFSVDFYCSGIISSIMEDLIADKSVNISHLVTSVISCCPAELRRYLKDQAIPVADLTKVH